MISTNRRNNVLLQNGAFIALVAFAIVKPDSLAYIGLSAVDNALIVLDVVLLLILVISLPTYKVSKISLFIILMYGFMTISTVINAGDYSFLIKTIGPATAICLFTDYCMQKCMDKFISINFWVWFVLSILNIVSIILFPGGMYATDRLSGDCYLLGFDNGFIYVLLPMVGFAMLDSVLKDKPIINVETLFALGLLLFTEILVWSASGILAAVIMLVFVVMASAPIVRRLLRPYLLVGFFYIVTFAVVVLRVQDLFEPIIVGMLHKDLTLTGRTYMWDYAIGVILENPILGVGQGGYTVVGQYNSYLHPHCLLLDMLYKGGICMFTSFTVVICRFCKNIKSFINHPAARVVLMVVVCILFEEIANSAQYKPYFWCFIVMSQYMPELCGEEGEKNIRFIKITAGNKL